MKYGSWWYHLWAPQLPEFQNRALQPTVGLTTRHNGRWRPIFPGLELPNTTLKIEDRPGRTRVLSLSCSPRTLLIVDERDNDVVLRFHAVAIVDETKR